MKLRVDKSKKLGIFGCKINSYLLEKTRVVYQAGVERNFHIFYQICSACQQDQKLKELYALGPPGSFRLLSQSKCMRIEGVSDEIGFYSTLEGLGKIGFSDLEIDVIWRIISGILHLGNIDIEDKFNEQSSTNYAVIAKDSCLQLACVQLGIDVNELSEALITRLLGLGSIQRIPINKNDAISGRDSLCKALYSALFDWIISRMNEKLKFGSESTSDFAAVLSEDQSCIDDEDSFIGILDIFGFETFDVNSFEQFW